jgi:hypothetical protein
MRYPQGKISIGWKNRFDYAGHPYIQVSFRTQDSNTGANDGVHTFTVDPTYWMARTAW